MNQENLINSNKRRYFPALDLLKFVCALFIVLHHYQMVFNLWFEGRLNFNNGYFYFGFLVELFFMISGFLMENGMQGREYGDFGIMIKRKYFRFFPMCFLSITVYTLLQWIGVFISGDFFNNGQVISFWNYMVSAFLLSKGWGIDIYRPANSSIWYISILLICYIWHYILNKLANKLNISVIYFYFAMVIIGLNLHNKEIKYAFLDNDCAVGYITTFLGMILFRLVSNYRTVSRKTAYAIVIIVTVWAAILVKYGYWNIFKESQQYFLIFIIYPPILCILSSSKIMNGEGLYRISKYLGKLSYEIYLWHFPLLILMNIIIYITDYPIVHGYKSMVVFEGVVIVFSILVCIFIEPQLDKFTNKIMSNL